MTSPWVFHADLDQFLVAVERLRRPALNGVPVIVGGRGDPTERAVVSTASYEARAVGVRSGMPLRFAVRRCPQAILLPVDHPVYDAASAQVMATLRAHPGAVVEVLGWDEAFVGVHSTDPQRTADRLRAEVFAATGLHCSVGIGDTLVRAKIATGFGKPRGTFTLTGENWLDVLGDRPTTDLWGVGKRIGARLHELGIDTVRQLAAADRQVLVAAFGRSAGSYLAQLRQGLGRRWPDDTPRVAAAHGRETTFQTDLTSPEQVREALRELAGQVVAAIEKEGRPAIRVQLKARFAPFFTFTKVRKLSAPTFDPDVLAETAFVLFDALADDRPVRLLGVRAEMAPPPAGDAGANG